MLNNNFIQTNLTKNIILSNLLIFITKNYIIDFLRI